MRLKGGGFLIYGRVHPVPTWVVSYMVFEYLVVGCPGCASPLPLVSKALEEEWRGRDGELGWRSRRATSNLAFQSPRITNKINQHVSEVNLRAPLPSGPIT